MIENGDGMSQKNKVKIQKYFRQFHFANFMNAEDLITKHTIINLKTNNKW